MRYATVRGFDLSIEASPGARAICPTCESPVIAKCGQINVWHWAHERGLDCDPWSEPMTVWHRAWQNLAPPHRREVRMGGHRADIVSNTGRVFEIQHSSISVEEIRAREAFYGDMVWIFDAREAYAEDRLDLRVKSGAQPDLRTFRWKHARKSTAACRRNVLLDLGIGHVLSLGRIYPKAPCGGWGLLVPVAEVARHLAPTPEEATA